MKEYRLKNNTVVTKQDLVDVLNWCKKYVGRSKYFPIKKLKLRINSKLKFLGEFGVYQNTIYVNPENHENFLHLVETVIHEYIHFRQNPREYDRLARNYTFEDYFDHPHEQEAELLAVTLGKIYYKTLKNGKINAR